MRDAVVGRVLVASLHQGIADILPVRLGFYESWLHAEGLRHGTIGMAPLTAVLSFLRQEGAGYDRTMQRAGECAAEWTVETMSSAERSMIGAMPAWLRSRVILRAARRLVHDSCQTNHATARVRRGTARVELHDSVFCSVREPVAVPLCGYYAAAVARLLTQFGIDADAGIDSCRGKGDPACVLTVALGVRRAADDPERSAA